MRESVLKELTDAGFSRVTVDLAGFSSGSMNKGLTIR
jgi:PP-loop superfamily ATP-utilizing enzyme